MAVRSVLCHVGRGVCVTLPIACFSRLSLPNISQCFHHPSLWSSLCRAGKHFCVADIARYLSSSPDALLRRPTVDCKILTISLGLHIYMAGVGIQQLFILIFVFFATQLHRALLRGEGLDRHSQKQALRLLYTVYAVLALITVTTRTPLNEWLLLWKANTFCSHQLRIVFRLCEYSNGLDSTIPNHEAYQYCLDSLPMLLAFILLSIVHPCRIMPGKECEIPSRRERKKTGARCKHIFTSPSLESHGQMRRSWPSEV